MRDEYDFSKGKRGPAIPSKGKTRITIYLDDEILESFRERAEARGLGYQTLINEALKAHLQNSPEQPLTESDLRRVLREELVNRTSD
ncbi:BrnA antitoxin family protein (plasmid) [Euhalothece natronophila Z-M001]|uniref:BrnA antitoxin family protein n=1 Tax=Euhalothece natronophila Z-M001 TaxID=522448 RepID=A0A5B8NRA7_9CHRO|nr:BrnA antitoxin family protein [Euhalothece natronophila]QDZ41614.1 BrnA antitoxin family protein [Euhalothece natronophila Z-M001]